jgi:hypothetical protein
VAAIERVAGEGSARVVRPIVARAFRSPLRKDESRRALGLPPEGFVAVVSGGGWGVGEIERAASAALLVPALTVVCLCGRNEPLRRRLETAFAGEERVRILSFSDRMPLLLAAADVLIDSTVGVTCLEALSVGCRVLVFGAPPGHSRANAAELAAVGLVEAPRGAAELSAALLRLATSQESTPSPSSTIDATEAAAAILSVQPRTLPVAQRRRRAPVAAAVAVAALVLTGWTIASPTPYPVVARTFDLGGLRDVDTTAPEVSLVIAVRPTRLHSVERVLAAFGAHASFAVSGAPSPTALSETIRRRDGVLPALERGGAIAAFHAGSRLRRLAHALDLRGRFYYLAPTSGYTLTDYLAGRAVGGSPVVGTSWDGAHPAALRAGSIIVVNLYGASRLRSLARLISALSARGLRPVPLDVLLASAKARAIGSARASASAPPPVRSSASTSRTSRAADAGHHSRARSGASATGTNVVRAKTRGAT